jgi:hypothetical protein
MTAPHAQSILAGYMARLESELDGVSPAGRADLLSHVENHIAEARALLPDESDADLLNMLDRLGTPAELAHEARESTSGNAPPVPARGRGALEVAALVACVVFVPLGLVLAWASEGWSRRDKVTATSIWLGVPLAVVVATEVVPAIARTGPIAFHPQWLVVLSLGLPLLNPVGLVCAAFLAIRWRRGGAVTAVVAG